MNLFNNKRVVDVILARYAQRLQNPAKRSHICLVIYGTEGDGKNRFLAPIYKIFGGEYTTTLDTAKKLYETHSTYEKDKLLVLVNEAKGASNFENADIIKARITEEDLWVNPKGIQPFKISLICDYDMTTNNANVVKITDDSTRRFFQVETTEYYRGNTAFFNDFSNNIVDNPIALRQIYEGLINFNVDEIIPSGNFQNEKPTTEIEKEVKKHNREKLLYFIEDLVKNADKDKICLKYDNKELFIEWRNWNNENSIKSEMNNIQFGLKLSHLMKKNINKDYECIKKDTNNGKTTIFIKETKAFFRKLNGVEFIEDDD